MLLVSVDQRNVCDADVGECVDIVDDEPCGTGNRDGQLQGVRNAVHVGLIDQVVRVLSTAVPMLDEEGCAAGGGWGAVRDEQWVSEALLGEQVVVTGEAFVIVVSQLLVAGEGCDFDLVVAVRVRAGGSTRVVVLSPLTTGV